MEPPATNSAFRVLIRPPSSSASATKTPSVAASTSHADRPPSSPSPSPPPSAAPNPSSSASSPPPPPPPPPPEGVVVVGFVGCGTGDGVAHLINLVLDTDVFGSGGLDKDLCAEGSEYRNWFRHRRITYYYEPEKGIVFLQFSSSAVMSLLGSACTASEGGDSRLESFVEQHDSDDLRGLLLMFSVCHVIIFLHEGTRLDTYLLKKFRVLQGAKHALAPFIRSHVMSTAAHKAPTFPAKPTVQIKFSPSPGRAGSGRHGSAISLMSGSSSHPSVLPGQCIPVVLFVFLDDSLDGPSCVQDSSDPSSINKSSHVTAAPRKGQSSKGSTSVVMLSRPMSKTEGSIRKKLQASLETQIRFLIKRSRVLSSMESGHPSSRGAGNVYSLPLFSLDASKVAVLLDRSTILGGESLNFVTNLIEQVLSAKGTFDILESDAQISSNEDILSIKDFVSRQSDILRGRGSITACTGTSSVTGVGMVAAAAAAAAASAASGKTLSVPKLPSLENWLSTSNLILNALISVKHVLVDENENMKKIMLQKTAVVAQDEGLSGIANNAREAAISWLESTKGMNMKFSMSWCQRVLPVAKEIYLKELPACYPTAVHRAQMEKALNAFHQMVKGPAAQMFASKLEEECTSIWETGRQLCDAISLTGNPCMHQRHHVKAGGPQSEERRRKHASGFVFLNACSCGRVRRLRDDPFDFESANITFSCFPNCEGLLPRLVIPEENKAGPVHASSWNLICLGGARCYDPSKGLLQSGFCSNENVLLKWTISLEKCPMGIDTVQNIPSTHSSKDSKVELTEEIDEANFQIGTSENDQREASKTTRTESTISFGKGLPSFVMKKAFSEVVAGTAVSDTKVLLQQRKQPKVPAEKGVKHRTENNIMSNQAHNPNGGQEFRRTRHASIQQGIQTSFHVDADPFLQIGSNVVPVNIDCGQKTKPKGFMKQVNVYIGFEHECPHGHRFLLSTEHLKELDSSYSLLESSHSHPSEDSSGRFAEKSTEMNVMKEDSHKKRNISGGKISPATNMRKKNKMIEVLATPNQHYLEKENNQPSCGEILKENCFPVRLDDGSSAFSILNRNLPLYMNCPHCVSSKEKDEKKFKFASKVSQLRRIFLVTPPFPFVFSMCPVIQFEDSCLPPSVLDREQHSQFCSSCPIILPPESFLTFCLPFIYGIQLDDGSLKPLHHLKHQPELTAWLVKGTTLQLMSEEFNIIDDFNVK